MKTKRILIAVICVLAVAVVGLLLSACASNPCKDGHTWEDATCTTPATCSVCGETDGAKLGHEWEGGDCTTKQTCARCGESGSYIHQKSTEKCGYIHCPECGEWIDSKPHNYNSNGVCTYCGEAKEIEYMMITSDDDDYWRAVSAAQKVVKNELKSPSTAKFPLGTNLASEDTYGVQKIVGGNEYIVAGYVDAQNGFGATIRQTWIATFTMSDVIGDKYTISGAEVLFL